MYIAKIHTAAAGAAALVLAQGVGALAFMAGPLAAARGGVAGVSSGVLAESTMVDTGATLRFCHASIGLGVERSSFCSRQLPASRPRWWTEESMIRGLGRRSASGAAARARGRKLSMRASGGGAGGKGESTRNRVLGTVVR